MAESDSSQRSMPVAPVRFDVAAWRDSLAGPAPMSTNLVCCPAHPCGSHWVKLCGACCLAQAQRPGHALLVASTMQVPPRRLSLLVMQPRPKALQYQCAMMCLPLARSCGGSILRRARPTNVAYASRSQAVACHGCSHSMPECRCRASNHRGFPSMRCPRLRRWRPASDAACNTRLIVLHRCNRHSPLRGVGMCHPWPRAAAEGGLV